MASGAGTSTSEPGGVRIGVAVPGRLAVRDAVDVARAAEASGAASVWVTENLYFPGAFGLAGAIAGATTRVRVGVGTVSPFARHPVILAMESAALGELSGGRFTLGLGAGPAQFVSRLGVSTEHPLEVVREAAEIARRLFDGAIACYEGRQFTVRNVRLDFDRTAPPPPIYIGASGDRMLDAAGEIADGVIFSLMCSLPFIQRGVERIRTAAVRASRSADGLGLVAYVPCAVDDDAERARDRVKPTLAENIARFAGKPALERLMTVDGVLDREEIERIARGMADGARPRDLIGDDLVDAFSVAGDDAACLARLRAYAATGVPEVTVYNAGPDEQSRETVRRLVQLSSLLAAGPARTEQGVSKP